MGTKSHPSAHDAYAKAADDEPLFCLLASDASAPALIDLWAKDRERHGEDAGVVAEARECAAQMRNWYGRNRSITPRALAAVEIDARISTRPDLVDRFRGGDLDALVDLIELGTGAKIDRSRSHVAPLRPK